MGLSKAAGSFAQPSSTGNQAITGLGFQPKVVLFRMTGATADGNVDYTWIGVGAATSSSARWFTSAMRENNLWSRHTFVATRCIGLCSNEAGASVQADFVSMDSDGFTINWTAVDATARVVEYFALGGSDLTNAIALSFLDPGATGNQAFTGAGFQATAMLTHGGGFGDGYNYDAQFSMCAATSATERGGLTTSGQDSTDGHRYQRTTAVRLGQGAGPSDVISQEADLVSFDADGFTLNYSTSGGSASRFGVVLLAGPQMKVVAFTEPGSTGNQSVSVGFPVEAYLLGSFGLAAGTTVQTTFNASVGWYAGAAGGTVWFGSGNYAFFDSDTQLSRSRVLHFYTHGDTPTLNAAVEHSSFSGDDVILNWTSVNGSRQVLMLAIGPAAAGSGAFPFAGQPMAHMLVR